MGPFKSKWHFTNSIYIGCFSHKCQVVNYWRDNVEIKERAIVKGVETTWKKGIKWAQEKRPFSHLRVVGMCTKKLFYEYNNCRNGNTEHLTSKNNVCQLSMSLLEGTIFKNASITCLCYNYFFPFGQSSLNDKIMLIIEEKICYF